MERRCGDEQEQEQSAYQHARMRCTPICIQEDGKHQQEERCHRKIAENIVRYFGGRELFFVAVELAHGFLGECRQICAGGHSEVAAVGSFCQLLQ